MAVEAAGRARDARGYIAAIASRDFKGPDPVRIVRLAGLRGAGRGAEALAFCMRRAAPARRGRGAEAFAFFRGGSR